jgi:hypothetical protein
MTLDDFIKKYDGKVIDFDKAYGGQCVDLYRFYLKEVLQIPQSPPVNGAKDIWNAYQPEYFDKIANTPEGIPQKGDIIIWGSDFGKYGHVAIYLEGDVNNFISFDQNSPIGTPCHKQKHILFYK